MLQEAEDSMPAPTNTYNSSTDLSLGQVPQVEDEDLYLTLLDIHNAIEILIISSDDANKRQYVHKLVTADYTITIDDYLILVDTTIADVTITLPLISDALDGFIFEIKQVIGDNETLVVGSAGELLDSDAGGVTLDLLEAIPIKNDGTEWWITN